ncbi:MAG: 6-pyruvoyl trahydropterin synthase family protein [Phycisphaerales bacterium]|jgi:6-pyruvoyltetrahydropterin/6-carboxytetrahydropterin synthase
MYTVRIERTFSAAHAIDIRGEREPLHGHDWVVTAELSGESLDSDGLLVDFHDVESSLERIVGRFRNRNLNETAPFDRVNPTAELVAQYVAVRLAPSMPRGVHVRSVSVREAPGCIATYVSPFGSHRG